MTDLTDITGLVAELTHWLPRAHAYTAIGDGIRSPNPDGSSGTDIAYSDPVGELVAGQHPALDQADEHITAARNELAKAVSTVHSALPAPSIVKRLRPTGDPGCVSCKRAKVFSPTRPGSTLCEWCYRWRQAHQALPPIGVLDARAQGKRITTRIVEEATRAARTHRNRKKTKR